MLQFEVFCELHLAERLWHSVTGKPKKWFWCHFNNLYQLIRIVSASPTAQAI